MSAEQEQAITTLRKLLPPGNTVHTILRHVAPSGMTRWISLVVVGKDGSTRDITSLAAIAMGDSPPRWDARHEGMRVGGVGMDMGFHLVYNLSRTLYRDGYNCIEYKRGEMVTRCTECGRVLEPTQDGVGLVHAGDEPDHVPVAGKPYRAIGEPKLPDAARYSSGTGRKWCPANDHVNVHPRSLCPYRHRDGGYALNHRWL